MYLKPRTKIVKPNFWKCFTVVKADEEIERKNLLNWVIARVNIEMFSIFNVCANNSRYNCISVKSF